jgi:hypothetical protein
VTRKSPSCQKYTSFGVWPRDHNKMFQWFHLACNVLTEVPLPMWASHPPRSPILCVMGSNHHSFAHTILRFRHHSFTEHPSGLLAQLLRIAGWYVKTSLYHILCQTVLSHPFFKPKPNADSMCAQESSLHTYHTENGYKITNVTIYNLFTE